MRSLTESHHAGIAEICRRFRVERLDLFGSGTSDRFDPAASDLDFIVTFAERASPGYADRYLDFAEALEAVLQRRVDLLTERSIRNPIFRETVTATRQSVYDRRSEKAAA